MYFEGNGLFCVTCTFLGLVSVPDVTDAIRGPFGTIINHCPTRGRGGSRLQPEVDPPSQVRIVALYF